MNVIEDWASQAKMTLTKHGHRRTETGEVTDGEGTGEGSVIKPGHGGATSGQAAHTHLATHPQETAERNGGAEIHRVHHRSRTGIASAAEDGHCRTDADVAADGSRATKLCEIQDTGGTTESGSPVGGHKKTFQVNHG